MSTGIILASHGEFAKAALGSAEMLAGEQKDVHALALTTDKSLDDLEKEVADAYADLSSRCDVVIALCDIYGGSPFNAVSRCMLKGMNMIGFTGLNLPILIDLLLSREISAEEVKEHVMSVHQQSVCPIEVQLAGDDEEDMDL